ncbi:hypothetical protein D3C73_1472650 [compost metagenome]
MQKLLTDKLQPIENKILDLIGQKNKVFDEIVVLRDELIRDCIHPFEHVVEDPIADGLTSAVGHSGIYTCKFCNKKVALNDVSK